MKNLSYIKLSIALISIFGMSLPIHAMNRKETMQAKYAPIKEEHKKNMEKWNTHKNKQEEERASLLNHGSSASYNSFSINGHPDDMNKIKEAVQERGDKANNLLQKTGALRESADEFQQGIKELRNITVAKKAATTVLFKISSTPNENPAPTSPTNTVTTAHAAETKTLIKEKEETQDAGCFFGFSLCCDEE